MTDMQRLFSPSSIALVGASANPEKLSGRPYRYLVEHGYDGEIHLVNPKRDAIDDKHCYDSITDVPEQVDLAMLLVPAELTPSIVEECGEADVPFAVVIASGFSETDRGTDLEAELLASAEAAGVRLIGPNSEGVVNVPDGIGASFSSILKRDELLPGSVSFVTQSGAFGGALFQYLQDRGVGANKWLSTGNESDLTTLDFLEYLIEDSGTDVVFTYIEALDDGERLLALGCRAAETDTSIVAMRAGASTRGRQATASHTGSIATDDAIYDALFEQAGVVRTWSVAEVVDYVTALSTIPPSSYPAASEGDGTGLGVVSVSGGAAALIADVAAQCGLPVAEFDAGTVDAIREEIPFYGSATNPVDVTGGVVSSPAVFERCIRSVVRDGAVEALLLQFGNSGGETIEACREELLAVQAESDVPIVTVFTGGRPRQQTAEELREAGVLVFEDPTRAVRTIGVLADQRAFRDRTDRRSGPVDVSGRRPFPGDAWGDVSDALADEGLRFPRTEPAATVDDAVAVAEDVGYPVAVKFDPAAVEHKSDVGGVHTDLADEGAVRSAYRALDSLDVDGEILVQDMVDGVEVIVGITDDPDFGPVMLFGPGGVFVELFDEFAYRGLPVTEATAREMIAETPVADLLEGYRDRPPGDADALASLMASASDAYETYEMTELELNPIVVTDDDALAVDFLVD